MKTTIAPKTDHCCPKHGIVKPIIRGRWVGPGKFGLLDKDYLPYVACPNCEELVSEEELVMDDWKYVNVSGGEYHQKGEPSMIDGRVPKIVLPTTGSGTYCFIHDDRSPFSELSSDGKWLPTGTFENNFCWNSVKDAQLAIEEFKDKKSVMAQQPDDWDD